jgi:hypothetical protein
MELAQKDREQGLLCATLALLVAPIDAAQGKVTLTDY